MGRVTVWTVPLLTMVGALCVAGCDRATPSESFLALARAAEQGDVDGVLDGLTARSRAIVEGVLAAAPDADALLAPTRLEGSVTIVAAASEGERAELLVRGAEGPPVPIVLAWEHGRWRVDLVECQRLWSRPRGLGAADDDLGPGGTRGPLGGAQLDIQ